MKFDDISATQKQRIDVVSKRLSEKHGFDFKQVLKDPTPLDEHIESIKKKMNIIESKTKFGSYQTKSEWKRLKLVLEGLMALNEKKGRRANSVEDNMDAAIARGDRDQDFKDRKGGKDADGKKFKGKKETPEQKKAREKREKLKAARLARDGMNEGVHRFAMITESELERAELVLAARNIVDELQDMVEDLSKTKVEKLSPLVDRMKAEHGLDMAEQFNSSVTAQLDSALETLTTVKDSIDTETLKISGDVEADAVTDMEGGDDMDLGDDALDLGGDDELDMGGDELDLGDEGGEEGDELDLGEPEEVERELKESNEYIEDQLSTARSMAKAMETKKPSEQEVRQLKEKLRNLKSLYPELADINREAADLLHDLTSNPGSANNVANGLQQVMQKMGAMNESKITVELTTFKGKKGKKFFESKKDMRSWLNENEEKIAKVTKVTEGK